MHRLTIAILMTGAVALAVACAPAGDQPARATASETHAAPELVRPDGSYPTRPLEKDTVVVKVVQNGVKNLQDFDNVADGLAANLQAMLGDVERACTEGSHPDFILFNEFPLTGYSYGSRSEKLEFTITVPGPETDALCEAARACDSYIIFGSYARDDEWPGHILSINTVINRQGEIAQEFWKTRNVKRIFPGGEIPTTTVESVRDRFRERYGIEQEFPVLQTEYGNIAVSTVQLDAFVYAAFAMRGVEIMFRTATLFSTEDVKAMARFNNFYSAMSNIIFPPDSRGAPYGGNSLIVSPDGEVLAEAPGNVQAIIEAEIPIAELRTGRTIPRFPVEVVAPVFEQYRQEIPLNHMDLPAEQLPPTREAMGEHLDALSRWLDPAAEGE
ncbi:MAG: nitrilase-related carbon-nitrogen hydrolase [Thermoanaerobaculales bacterium]|jgi:predicted amidohydrolase|nr:nitrilase-related carbon-nitrogen hydrolase [Thermoanaerobaculales bacterium]